MKRANLTENNFEAAHVVKTFGDLDGIVANTDLRNYCGRWVWFDKTSKELKDNDFPNWRDLEF